MSRYPGRHVLWLALAIVPALWADLPWRLVQPSGPRVSSVFSGPLRVARGTPFREASAAFRFSCSVAAWSMLLNRDSGRGDVSLDDAIWWASTAGADTMSGNQAQFLAWLRLAAAEEPLDPRFR